ncbi:MAG: hypothetical protein JXC85_02090 [Candidatus Aenigmarchaeota archaeon]|nr:hypothetical protein [Candidatus Aenigmarchaeota archaeon]
MLVESFEKHMRKTCKRCYTIFDRKRDYCCAKGKDECFADLGLVNRGIWQDDRMANRLYDRRMIDDNGNLLKRSFFRGLFVNECLVYDYRPPGCRAHFCDKWDKYMRENPLDFVQANLRVVSTATMLREIGLNFQFGIKLAYPGGFIIFTEKPGKIRKALMDMFLEMKVHNFTTEAGRMDPEDNKKPGVEIIMDKKGIIAKPGLFGTIIENNIFMLVRMKMNLGSTGIEHSNILITTADSDKIAGETPASLKSFHALIAYQL